MNRSNLFLQKTRWGLIIGALLGSETFAIEWEKGGSLALDTYYSSNICQTTSEEIEKTVGTVTPRFLLDGAGRRTNVALDAAVEYNTLGESSLECPSVGNAINQDSVRTWIPRANFSGELETIENWVSLFADASAFQNPIDPFARGQDGGLNATGNANINYRWGAGARLQRRHSEEWSSFVSYEYNEQYNSADRALADSVEDRVLLDVGMIPGASRVSIGITGNYSEVKFEETPSQPVFENRLTRAGVRGAVQMSRSWSANAITGIEDNVLTSEIGDTDGPFWDFGISWSPNSRIAVDLGYGERFFGDTPRAGISYRHKRHALEASYLRDLQFPRNIRSNTASASDSLVPPVELPGEPLPVGDPTFIGQSPLLNDRFSLSYSFTARKTSVTVNASDSDQTVVSNGTEGSFQSLGVTLRRELGDRLSADVGVRYRKNAGDLNGVERNFESSSVSVGFQGKISRSVSLTGRYTYLDADNNLSTLNGGFDGPALIQNQFDEHRVSLGLVFVPVLRGVEAR